MKIALISEASSLHVYELRRLKEEGDLLNIPTDHFKYSDITIDFGSEKLNLFVKDINLIESYDIFILRASKRKDVLYDHYKGIINYLAQKNSKFVLNSIFFSQFNNISEKIFDYTVMTSNSIPIIPSINIAHIEDLDTINLKELEFPIITKKAKSSHGNGVSIHYNIKELRSFFEKNTPENFLIQPYINSGSSEKEDIRIITLGNKVIGGYKKVAPKGSIITNIGAGGHTAPLELTSDLIEISQKVSEVFKSDYLGIDIIINNGKPQVLEINKAAQFEGFENATKINLARLILKYCIDHSN